jgi:hypothetical protein
MTHDPQPTAPRRGDGRQPAPLDAELHLQPPFAFLVERARRERVARAPRVRPSKQRAPRVELRPQPGT